MGEVQEIKDVVEQKLQQGKADVEAAAKVAEKDVEAGAADVDQEAEKVGTELKTEAETVETELEDLLDVEDGDEPELEIVGAQDSPPDDDDSDVKAALVGTPWPDGWDDMSPEEQDAWVKGESPEDEEPEYVVHEPRPSGPVVVQDNVTHPGLQHTIGLDGSHTQHKAR